MVNLQAFAFDKHAASSAQRVAIVHDFKRQQNASFALWTALSEDTLALILSHLPTEKSIVAASGTTKALRRLSRAALQSHHGLSHSQFFCFRRVLEARESVLLLGQPGAGKSFLLSLLKDRMRHVVVTASTGCAADKLGGGALTLHSALGLGHGTQSLDALTKKLRDPRSSVGRRVAKMRALILDEASMIPGGLLELVFELLNRVKGSNHSTQFVVCADPLQLLPIESAHSRGRFFECEAIQSLLPTVLTESFRQAESPFLSVLRRARRGVATAADLAWLYEHSACPRSDVPRLVCLRAEAESINASCLASLQGPDVVFQAEDAFHTRVTEIAELSVEPLLSKKTVRLRLHARVMLVKNMAERRLHNGSIGTVSRFFVGSVLVDFDGVGAVQVSLAPHEVVRDGVLVATRKQLPLVLAYATSIHKAQGSTLAKASMELGRCFAKGQAYVSLSRVREISDCSITGLSLSALNNVDRPSLRFFNDATEASEDRREDVRMEEQRADEEAFWESDTVGRELDALLSGAQ